MIVDIADPKCNMEAMVADFWRFDGATTVVELTNFSLTDVFKWLRTHNISFIGGRRMSELIVNTWITVGWVERRPSLGTHEPPITSEWYDYIFTPIGLKIAQGSQE